MPEHSPEEIPSMPQKLWERRYLNEGAIWGWKPSQTAQLLSSRLESGSRVLELGFGYGRDLVAVAKKHRVTGIEQSPFGIDLAKDRLKAEGLQAQLLIGDFSKTNFETHSFDGLYSHRMLHLLGDGDLVTAFVDTAVRALKPGGALCVSARDLRDFDAQQMQQTSDGLFRYKDSVKGRAGHVIRFWNEESFQTAFGDQFKILLFEQASEVEAESNSGKRSHFTIMVAEKKVSGR